MDAAATCFRVSSNAGASPSLAGEMRVALLLAVLLAAAVLAGCGGGAARDPEPGPKITPPPGVRPAARVGPAEGRLDLIAPAGFVPDAARRVPGCNVRVAPAADGDDVVRRFRDGDFDGALGTADVTVRLIAAGAIDPLNTKLIPAYDDVYDGLKDQPFNAVAGRQFALPVGRAAQLLVWRRNAIPGSLTNLGALLDPPQTASLGEHLVVPDDPNAIAVAALWIARQRADLKITDPYELDRRQFDAVLRILRLQHPYVNAYWRDPETVREAFLAGDASAGLAPTAVVGDLTERPGDLGPVGSVRPREGSLGVSPAWMLAADAKHPNCMYRFMRRALDPAVNARVALDNDLAPATPEACEVIEAQQGDGRYCDLRRASDDDFYAKVLFRTFPSSDCGDARGLVCQDWNSWTRAWQRIKRG